jgi:hypothetical protein
MIQFTAAELTDFRAFATDSMLDECVILNLVRDRDEGGEETKTYVDGVTSICGLSTNQGTLVNALDKSVLTYDGTLRLPMGTMVDETNHIRITKRVGEDVTPFEYSIASPVQRGPIALRIRLKAVSI